MKNINYKIVTLVLSGILIVTYTWHWEDIFNHDNNMSGMKMDMSNKKTGHMMKMQDGSMMEMTNDTMQMGHGNIKVESGMEMGSMSMDNMIGMMQGKTGKALEKEFLTGMIPHHKGAVEMAKLLLQDKTVNPEIRAFAENIIKAQDSEILFMNKWLKNY